MLSMSYYSDKISKTEVAKSLRTWLLSSGGREKRRRHLEKLRKSLVELGTVHTMKKAIFQLAQRCEVCVEKLTQAQIDNYTSRYIKKKKGKHEDGRARSKRKLPPGHGVQSKKRKLASGIQLCRAPLQNADCVIGFQENIAHFSADNKVCPSTENAQDNHNRVDNGGSCGPGETRVGNAGLSSLVHVQKPGVTVLSGGAGAINGNGVGDCVLPAESQSTGLVGKPQNYSTVQSGGAHEATSKHSKPLLEKFHNSGLEVKPSKETSSNASGMHKTWGRSVTLDINSSNCPAELQMAVKEMNNNKVSLKSKPIDIHIMSNVPRKSYAVMHTGKLQARTTSMSSGSATSNDSVISRKDSEEAHVVHLPPGVTLIRCSAEPAAERKDATACVTSTTYPHEKVSVYRSSSDRSSSVLREYCNGMTTVSSDCPTNKRNHSSLSSDSGMLHLSEFVAGTFPSNSHSQPESTSAGTIAPVVKTDPDVNYLPFIQHMQGSTVVQNSDGWAYTSELSKTFLDMPDISDAVTCTLPRQSSQDLQRSSSETHSVDSVVPPPRRHTLDGFSNDRQHFWEQPVVVHKEGTVTRKPDSEQPQNRQRRASDASKTVVHKNNPAASSPHPQPSVTARDVKGAEGKERQMSAHSLPQCLSQDASNTVCSASSLAHGVECEDGLERVKVRDSKKVPDSNAPRNKCVSRRHSASSSSSHSSLKEKMMLLFGDSDDEIARDRNCLSPEKFFRRISDKNINLSEHTEGKIHNGKSSTACGVENSNICASDEVLSGNAALDVGNLVQLDLSGSNIDKFFPSAADNEGVNSDKIQILAHQEDLVCCQTCVESVDSHEVQPSANDGQAEETPDVSAVQSHVACAASPSTMGDICEQGQQQHSGTIQLQLSPEKSNEINDCGTVNKNEKSELLESILQESSDSSSCKHDEPVTNFHERSQAEDLCEFDKSKSYLQSDDNEFSSRGGCTMTTSGNVSSESLVHCSRPKMQQHEDSGNLGPDMCCKLGGGDGEEHEGMVWLVGRTDQNNEPTRPEVDSSTFAAVGVASTSQGRGVASTSQGSGVASMPQGNCVGMNVQPDVDACTGEVPSAADDVCHPITAESDHTDEQGQVPTTLPSHVESFVSSVKAAETEVSPCTENIANEKQGVTVTEVPVKQETNCDTVGSIANTAAGSSPCDNGSAVSKDSFLGTMQVDPMMVEHSTASCGSESGTLPVAITAGQCVAGVPEVDVQLPVSDLSQEVVSVLQTAPANTNTEPVADSPTAHNVSSHVGTIRVRDVNSLVEHAVSRVPQSILNSSAFADFTFLLCAMLENRSRFVERVKFAKSLPVEYYKIEYISALKDYRTTAGRHEIKFTDFATKNMGVLTKDLFNAALSKIELKCSRKYTLKDLEVCFNHINEIRAQREKSIMESSQENKHEGNFAAVVGADARQWGVNPTSNTESSEHGPGAHHESSSDNRNCGGSQLARAQLQSQLRSVGPSVKVRENSNVMEAPRSSVFQGSVLESLLGQEGNIQKAQDTTSKHLQSTGNQVASPQYRMALPLSVVGMNMLHVRKNFGPEVMCGSNQTGGSGSKTTGNVFATQGVSAYQTHATTQHATQQLASAAYRRKQDSYQSTAQAPAADRMKAIHQASETQHRNAPYASNQLRMAATACRKEATTTSVPLHPASGQPAVHRRYEMLQTAGHHLGMQRTTHESFVNQVSVTNPVLFTTATTTTTTTTNTNSKNNMAVAGANMKNVVGQAIVSTSSMSQPIFIQQIQSTMNHYTAIAGRPQPYHVAAMQYSHGNAATAPNVCQSVEAQQAPAVLPTYGDVLKSRQEAPYTQQLRHVAAAQHAAQASVQQLGNSGHTANNSFYMSGVPGETRNLPGRAYHTQNNSLNLQHSNTGNNVLQVQSNSFQQYTGTPSQYNGGSVQQMQNLRQSVLRKGYEQEQGQTSSQQVCSSSGQFSQQAVTAAYQLYKKAPNVTVMPVGSVHIAPGSTVLGQTPGAGSIVHAPVTRDHLQQSVVRVSHMVDAARSEERSGRRGQLVSRTTGAGMPATELRPVAPLPNQGFLPPAEPSVESNLDDVILVYEQRTNEPRTVSRDSGYTTPSPRVSAGGTTNPSDVSDYHEARQTGAELELDTDVVLKCVRCGKTARELCSACRNAAYCSKVCQVKDWETVHYGICINTCASAQLDKAGVV